MSSRMNGSGPMSRASWVPSVPIPSGWKMQSCRSSVILTALPKMRAPPFTIADLNVAGVLSPSRAKTIGLAEHGEVEAWLARCYARPAARATRERFAA